MIALPCSWLAVEMKKAREQHAAVAAIVKLGGEVEWSTPSGAAWLRRLLGEEWFMDVERVVLCRMHCSDTGERWYDNVATDTRIEHLATLSKLKVAALSGTGVTDAGLEQLKRLRQLQRLYLCKTKVTNEGVKMLQQALPDCTIERE